MIAEGSPRQLKASVGPGALNVRLSDPAQRAGAERLLSLAVGPVVLDADPAGLRAPCADAGQAAKLVSELARAGVQIADFSYAQPSLDEVFLALTGAPRNQRVLVSQEVEA